MSIHITPNHPDSKGGNPIFIDDYGIVYSQAEGLQLVLKELGWTRQQTHDNLGYKPRSLDVYLNSKNPAQAPVALLNQLSQALHLNGSEKDPELCPYCASPDIEIEDTQSHGNDCHELCVCLSCGKTWQDVLVLNHRLIDDKKVMLKQI